MSQLQSPLNPMLREYPLSIQIFHVTLHVILLHYSLRAVIFVLQEPMSQTNRALFTLQVQMLIRRLPLPQLLRHPLPSQTPYLPSAAYCSHLQV